MKTEEKTLIEFNNYMRLTEFEFESKLKQQSSNLLVRISIPDGKIPPFYLELLDEYSGTDDSFQFQVKRDSSFILDFHTANQYDKKSITIFKKINSNLSDK